MEWVETMSFEGARRTETLLCVADPRHSATDDWLQQNIKKSP